MNRKAYKSARRMMIFAKLGEMFEGLHGIERLQEEELSTPEQMLAELDEILSDDEELHFTPDWDEEE